MNKATKRIIIACILIFLALWFADVLPPQIAKLTAMGYMAKQDDGAHYAVKGAEYSPAHDCYFVYFTEKRSGGMPQRNIGILYRYFPFFTAFDSAYPG